MIKARNHRLHLNNVVVLGFLNPGLVPESVLKVKPLPQYMAQDEATPSQPTIKEEEEVVEVSNFEVFN